MRYELLNIATDADLLLSFEPLAVQLRKSPRSFDKTEQKIDQTTARQNMEKAAADE